MKDGDLQNLEVLFKDNDSQDDQAASKQNSAYWRLVFRLEEQNRVLRERVYQLKLRFSLLTAYQTKIHRIQSQERPELLIHRRRFSF